MLFPSAKPTVPPVFTIFTKFLICLGGSYDWLGSLSEIIISKCFTFKRELIHSYRTSASSIQIPIIYPCHNVKWCYSIIYMSQTTTMTKNSSTNLIQIRSVPESFHNLSYNITGY